MTPVRGGVAPGHARFGTAPPIAFQNEASALPSQQSRSHASSCAYFFFGTVLFPVGRADCHAIIRHVPFSFRHTAR